MMPTITVRDLIASLEKQDPDMPVRVWLPGSTIALGAAFLNTKHGCVSMEGNIDEGSALDVPELGGAAREAALRFEK